MAGTGATRTVHVSDDIVHLKATCDAYITKYRTLQPESDLNRAVQLTLEKEALATSSAPKVVKFVPANGATGIDPNEIHEISVTFDQDMMTDRCSWCGDGRNYPETTGKPEWKDRRTCVLPVRLKPGQGYVFGINSPSHRNFMSVSGVSVEPVRYAITTSGN